MAKEKILMPKLGESVTEGTITSWLVKEGDHVQKYDPLAEVMTDKVNAEIPASFTGTISEITAQEGEVIAVHELIGYIETEENDDEVVETVENNEQQLEKNSEVDVADSTDHSMKNRYSPAVLKLASEHNIDLTTISGSGLGGRITRKDIRTLIEQPDKQNKAISSENQAASSAMKQPKVKNGHIEIPVTGVRKAIAANVTKSKQEIPHAWMTVEADVTGLVTYRNNIKDTFREREGYSLTYFAFFIHAVAKALREFPEINSTWQHDKIIHHQDIHISIAVANENELFVPVIKHVDDKSVQGIAKEITQLAYKARNNQLLPEDMEGGTFTVNNTGTFGSIASMGIINHPQAAILQVESIVKRPVIINDMFAARDIVNLSLSLDHRILDGLICGRFLARIKELVESIDETASLV